MSCTVQAMAVRLLNRLSWFRWYIGKSGCELILKATVEIALMSVVCRGENLGFSNRQRIIRVVNNLKKSKISTFQAEKIFSRLTKCGRKARI